MKKSSHSHLISFGLALLMILSFPLLGLANDLNTNIGPNENSSIDDINIITTKEPAMPAINIKSTLSSNTNTLQLPERKAWVATTTAELEAAYGQEVVKVEETSDVVRFIYKTEYYEPTGEFINQDGIACTPQQLLMTEYLKPESALAVQLNTNATSRALSTKINFYYDWSGYYYLQKKSAQSLNVASNVAILIASAITKPLSSVVLGVVNWLGYTILNSQPVQAETKVKYYYQTKAGCVLVNGVWMSTVQVGCRKGFGEWWASWRNSGNQPISDVRTNTGKPDSNPTNSPDSVEYKPNFNNHTWIHNKAIECYNSGVPYVDIYAIVARPIP